MLGEQSHVRGGLFLKAKPHPAPFTRVSFFPFDLRSPFLSRCCSLACSCLHADTICVMLSLGCRVQFLPLEQGPLRQHWRPSTSHDGSGCCLSSISMFLLHLAAAHNDMLPYCKHAAKSAAPVAVTGTSSACAGSHRPEHNHINTHNAPADTATHSHGGPTSCIERIYRKCAGRCNHDSRTHQYCQPSGRDGHMCVGLLCGDHLQGILLFFWKEN